MEGLTGAQTTTYYAWDSGGVIAEYSPVGANSLQWNKGYVYLGGRLLASLTNNSGTVLTQFQHPDRLGTRLTTDTSGTVLSENVNLPFGASMPNAIALNGSGQPTQGEGYLPSGASQSTKKRFTSYDRSVMTGLDYAVNRHYSSMQGRFTQIDPIEMTAANLTDPQTLNLYSYCSNDPINLTDPDGLFSFKNFWNGLKKAFKWIGVALSVAIAVLTVIYAPALFSTVMLKVFGIISSIANAVSSLAGALELNTLSKVFGIISAAASLGSSIVNFVGAHQALNIAREAAKTATDKLAAVQAVYEKVNKFKKTIWKAISDGASLVSKSLSMAGHKTLSQIFGLASTGTSFIEGGYRNVPNANKTNTFRWSPKIWDTFKSGLSAAEQSATMAGADTLAGYLNSAGVVGDILDIKKAAGKWSKPDDPLDAPGGIAKFWLTPQQHKQALFINRVKVLNTYAGKYGSVMGRADKAWQAAH